MNHNVTLTQLSYVLAVDRYRSFALAAKKRFVSQPTLSVQIQKVEEELGVILFDRKKKPVLPTEIGRVIIEQARRIIEESGRLEELVHQAQGVVKGEFRLGVIPSVASTLIPLFLKSFSLAYPEVRLVIDELQTEGLVQKLLDDQIDGGIAATPLENREIDESPLYLEEFLLYLSPDSSLSRRKTISQQDLKREKVWLMSEGHCFRNQVTQLCSFRDVSENKGGVNFESGDFQTLMRLVDQNYGVTLVPELVANHLDPNKRKKAIKRFVSPVPVREISFLSRRTVVKKAITDALIREIVRSYPGEKNRSQRVKKLRPT